ncbi:MAG: hypothetical protein HC883_04475, partial [Bdellovibrionaceae bacterium]|nr:hypothetical protein [Pseudobdellovibrionaceae bacterium]
MMATQTPKAAWSHGFLGVVFGSVIIRNAKIIPKAPSSGNTVWENPFGVKIWAITPSR